MSSAAAEIHRLLNENMNLFEMQDELDSPYWKAYVEYIDSIVSDSLLRTIGCRYKHFGKFLYRCSLLRFYRID